jgi:glutamyl-tRNA reductase
VEVRERLAFAPAEGSALLAAEREAGRSGLLLTTCNRTEFYWQGDHDMEPWFRQLGCARGADLTGLVNRLDGPLAVRHLFDVAAGLDSQILGELEILGQVRRACEQARAAGTLTREMAMVFGAAVGAGRRVRRETSLGRHPLSVSSAAVATALDLMGAEARRIVVLGAGEVGEGVLRALHERGLTDVTMVNRNVERAAAVANTWNIAARGWDELPALLASADVCFVTTSAKRACVGAGLLRDAAARREGRELVVLDLSVPRNVEPAARTLEGIRLLDLDDLQRLCCPVSEGTVSSATLRQAEHLLQEEITRLDLALRSRVLAPQLAELHRMGVEIADRETAWALSKLGELSEQQRQIVREMAQRLVRRVLYPVSRSIRLEDTGPDETEEPRSA